MFLDDTHACIIAWLHQYAEGKKNAQPRARLVEVVKNHAIFVGHPAIHHDMDRMVRIMCKECLAAGYPILSCGDGYYYGDPRNLEDFTEPVAQAKSRISALWEVIDNIRNAKDAELRRLANEAQPRQEEFRIKMEAV